MRVGVLQHESQARQSLHDAILRHSAVGRVELRHASSWPELLKRAKAGDIDVAVVEPWDTEKGRPAFPQLTTLQATVGEEAIVGYTSTYLWSPVDRIAIDQIGISLFTVGLDDTPGALRRAVAVAATWVYLKEAIRLLESTMRSSAFSIVRAALDLHDPTCGVRPMARALGVCPRAVRRNAARLGIPEPRRLRQWSKIFLAVGLGRLGIRSIVEIALHLGYQDGASVYRLFRSALDRTPGEVLGSEDEERRVLDIFLEATAG